MMQTYLQSRSVAAENDPSALVQVFGLPELVEQSMLALGPEDIDNARRISNIWNGTYLESKKVQRAAVLRPECFAREGIRLSLEERRFYPTHYYKVRNMKLHPSMDEFSCASRDHLYFQNYREGGRPVTPKDLADYVTMPWCSAVAASDTHWYDRSPTDLAHNSMHVYCIVYNPDGVRVQDIQAVSDSLLVASHREHVSSPTSC